MNEIKRRILVVDDDPSVLSLMRRMLRYEGYEVFACPDGRQCVELALLHRPHAIVLDLKMPGVDGLEVLERLRAAGVWVPVLILSAADEPELRARVAESSADDFMLKPMSTDEFVYRLGRLMANEGRNPD